MGACVGERLEFDKFLAGFLSAEDFNGGFSDFEMF